MMSTTRTVRARSMVYRNTDRRLQTHGHLNPRTGKFIASLSPTKLAPGAVFEATEEEYNDLLKAGAIVDVETDTDADTDTLQQADDLVG